jgi:glucosylceramidase
MARVQSAYPDLEMYWTEGGPDYTWPDYLTDWTKWGANFANILRNGCRAITAWNFALDEHGKPNIGPFSCGGVVTIHSETKEITRSGQYWALQHFSRSIRRDAQRFGSQGTLESITHVAFANSDGRNTLVLSNAGAGRSVTLQMGNYAAETELSGNSVTTFSWA